MTNMAIKWISAEEAMAADTSEERVLLEQTPDFYLEFNTFLIKEMERVGGDRFFRGPSGRVYRLTRVTDELSGVRGIALHMRGASETRGPRDQEEIDGDIWAFLEWLVRGVGGEWTVAALRKTGAIYKAFGAPERA